MVELDLLLYRAFELIVNGGLVTRLERVGQGRHEIRQVNELAQVAHAPRQLYIRCERLGHHLFEHLLECVFIYVLW